MQLKNILITTARRGVWFAQVEPETDLTPSTLQNLKNCRMAIYFGTTGGIQELCNTGPTEKSRIGHKADLITLHEVTAVFAVTEIAAEKWTNR